MPLTDLIPARGAAASLSMEVVRELTTEDLLSMGQVEGHTSVPMVQKLTARHHRQAQLLAEGLSGKEVAAAVGSTPTRIYQLQRDPSFMELVAYYQDQRAAAYLNDSIRIQGKLTILAETGLDELIERTEDPQKRAALPVSEVRAITTMALDRTVAPPKVAQQISGTPSNITLNFGRDLRPKENPGDNAVPVVLDQEKDQ